jgi:hypothetical protein
MMKSKRKHAQASEIPPLKRKRPIMQVKDVMTTELSCCLPEHSKYAAME